MEARRFNQEEEAWRAKGVPLKHGPTEERTKNTDVNIKGEIENQKAVDVITRRRQHGCCHCRGRVHGSKGRSAEGKGGAVEAWTDQGTHKKTDVNIGSAMENQKT